MSSYLSLGLPSGLFPSCFTIKTPYTFPSFPRVLHATTPFIFLDYPNDIWRGLHIRSSTTYRFFQSPVSFSLRPTNIPPHIATYQPLPTQETKSHKKNRKKKPFSVYKLLRFLSLSQLYPNWLWDEAHSRLYPKVNGDIPAGRKKLTYSRQVSTTKIPTLHH
jgi:hypothetical protein